MKYIRTKDGIIDISNLKIDTKYNCYVDEQDIFQYPLNKYREANTIEELCDEFIAMHEILDRTYCIRKVPFEKQDENFNIYGAIWTDKGLIYVAKMNEKGELELL